MTIQYQPRGVCSRQMTFDIEDGVIRSVDIVGGCSGNLQGIAALVRGMKAQEAIQRLKGIRCGGRPSSCPDQLACGLEQILSQR